MIHDGDELAQLAQWLLEHPDALDIALTLRQQTEPTGDLFYDT